MEQHGGQAMEMGDETRICALCGEPVQPGESRPIRAMRRDIAALIRADHPDLPGDARICRRDIGRYRRQHIEALLTDERGRLSDLDKDVVHSLATGQTVVQPPEPEDSVAAGFGDRMADRVASFGGSWSFILGFVALISVWMMLNVTGLFLRPFDAYPFILLNLVLSCVAALQAPVIMMSQRRQEAKDRRRAENDYRVNLKAELEIVALHDKIDHQWEHLLRIQQAQIEILNDEDLRP